MQKGVSTDVVRLRDAVARIEAGRWSRGDLPKHRHFDLPCEAPGPVPLGDGTLPLDAALGGGLRRATLHEVVAHRVGDAGAAAGFALCVAGLCRDAGVLVWIVEDCAVLEAGLPYRPGLAAHGIDPDRLILVRTPDARAALWAAEEALRLRAPAVLVELWGAKAYGLASSRRLLLAARGGRGTAVLLHAGLAGRGEMLSSAADTRFAVASHPSPRTASAGCRMPIPGDAAVAVRLLKHRLGGAAATDFERDHALVWASSQRCFDAHPLPVGLPALPADRPDRASRSGRRAGAVVALRHVG